MTAKQNPYNLEYDQNHTLTDQPQLIGDAIVYSCALKHHVLLLQPILEASFYYTRYHIAARGLVSEHAQLQSSGLQLCAILVLAGTSKSFIKQVLVHSAECDSSLCPVDSGMPWGQWAQSSDNNRANQSHSAINYTASHRHMTLYPDSVVQMTYYTAEF